VFAAILEPPKRTGAASVRIARGVFSLLSYLTLAIGLAVSSVLLGLAFRLLLSNRAEGRKNAARAPSVVDAAMGRSRAFDDWVPDGRVKGGMIFNRRKRRLEVSGRLSDDSLDRVFR
jgi:hypothetical protein